jgi:hypothetical protein
VISTATPTMTYARVENLPWRTSPHTRPAPESGTYFSGPGSSCVPSAYDHGGCWRTHTVDDKTCRRDTDTGISRIVSRLLRLRQPLIGSTMQNTTRTNLNCTQKTYQNNEMERTATNHRNSRNNPTVAGKHNTTSSIKTQERNEHLQHTEQLRRPGSNFEPLL